MAKVSLFLILFLGCLTGLGLSSEEEIQIPDGALDQQAFAGPEVNSRRATITLSPIRNGRKFMKSLKIWHA